MTSRIFTSLYPFKVHFGAHITPDPLHGDVLCFLPQKEDRVRKCRTSSLGCHSFGRALWRDPGSEDSSQDLPTCIPKSWMAQMFCPWSKIWNCIPWPYWGIVTEKYEKENSPRKCVRRNIFSGSCRKSSKSCHSPSLHLDQTPMLMSKYHPGAPGTSVINIQQLLVLSMTCPPTSKVALEIMESFSMSLKSLMFLSTASDSEIPHSKFTAV